MSDKEETLLVTFASHLSKSAKLIEVNNAFIQTIEQGEPLYLKGTATDEAVLCTSSQTFALKRVEQSNTVYLFHKDAHSNSAGEYNIRAQVKDFFEIIPTEGKTQVIPTLLAQTASSSSSSMAYDETMTYLSDNVMASDAEIQFALQRHFVINHDGQVNVFTFQQIIELFEVLFPLFIQHDIVSSKITESQLSSLISHVQSNSNHSLSLPIVHYLLQRIGQVTDEDNGSDIERIWTINDVAVAKYIVHIAFLRATRLTWSEILREIQARHPSSSFSSDSVSPSDLLSGLAVFVPPTSAGTTTKAIGTTTNSAATASTASTSVNAVYQYYPVENAPSELQRCLKDLFAIKREYSLEELDAYVAHYLPYTIVRQQSSEKFQALKQQKVGELLLVHTRIMENGLYRIKE